jgi:hypothetical protein
MFLTHLKLEFHIGGYISTLNTIIQQKQPREAVVLEADYCELKPR